MCRIFYPRKTISAIGELTPERLKKMGVQALLCDLDDTLTPYYDTAPSGDLVSWLGDMDREGIKICILSNGKKKRVLDLCRRLSIECVPMAMKPLPFGFLRARRLLGSARGQTAVVGDQVFTDILGGNLFGFFTILVDPIAYKPGAGARFKRRLEMPFRREYRNGI